jgi:hypothetical protein
MKIVKNLLVSLALAASFSIPAFATVTQTTAPAEGHSYGGWNHVEISRVDLAAGTNTILALSSFGTTWDQGWGGQDPGSNQVGVALYDNGNQVAWQRVGGAVHEVTSFTYTATAADLLNFNNVLGALNNNLTHNLSLRMMMAPLGYGGWQLHVNNAAFSVTSGEVPEPGSLALFGLALMGACVARRKFAK